MAVEVNTQRKVVEVKWDTELVKGSHASLDAGGEEKRNVANDGLANLTFPDDFTGDVDVVVRGSKSGEDTGTITVA